MTLCGLFPNRQGLLIGLATAYISISSMIPQGWLVIITSGKVTLSNMMFMWMGFAIFGLLTSTILFPWHVVTDPKEKVKALNHIKYEIECLFAIFSLWYTNSTQNCI